ncbi:disease resistance protein SUMM2-like isoform X2 [Vitis riparia]|uniref:disease resistance protein SUMM2-like isoform X2 n=1 Tax=Vitis riparia TaxID=96939 RepID=UPI00155A68D6|nr:disease resistance protein SUMM2-like isoform X2 [Vitis riparia]
MDVAADCAAKGVDHSRDQLPQNLDSLANAMEELKHVYQDVKERVKREEQFQNKRTREVDAWLCSVENMEREVNELMVKSDIEIQKKCLGSCCLTNCRSSYKLGKMIREKVAAVAELQSRADHLDEVPVPLFRPAVYEMPMDLFDRVWRWLEDEQVGTIGIYGMGGVGKTTLLAKINNRVLKRNNEFDVVIWITVSRPGRIELVQQQILNILDVPDYKWKDRSQDEKALEIFQVLKTRKFLLFLDDIWERLDLMKLGIPPLNNQNKSKVVLTTRFQDVCHQMEVQKMVDVKCLGEEEAFALFQANVGEDTLNSHPQIPNLARIIAQECRGLPLALVAIGRALAGSTAPEEWKKAAQTLKNPSYESQGTFSALELSYDRLPSDTIKSCFIYCSLFPEDREICCDQLIELWIGEGFLDEFDHIHEARNQGAGERGRKKKFVVQEEVELIEADEVAKWKEAQRISLWDCSVEELKESPSFLNLETLMVSCKLMSCPSGLFGYMPIIRVLDLSKNFGLIELPVEIDSLASLQYLNLSYTQIVKLPIQLEKLSKLRCLILDEMDLLQIIPRQLISKLSSLQLFSIFNSMVAHGDCKALLKELECLEHLNEISIRLKRALPTQTLFNSHKLRRNIRRLSLQDCAGMSFVLLSPHLQMLEIYSCSELRFVKISAEKEGPSDMVHPNFPSHQYFCKLREVEIVFCPRLLNLTWLAHAQNLLSLVVRNCESLEEVIGEGGGVAEIEQDLVVVFSGLKTLHLWSLPKLKSIHGRPLPFPSLREFNVRFCPSLRKLPFDSDTWASKNLLKIKGEEEWWDGLEWEDKNSAKLSLSPCFVPVRW